MSRSIVPKAVAILLVCAACSGGDNTTSTATGRATGTSSDLTSGASNPASDSISVAGRWIVFQKPYGRLFVVHPDGSGLHEVPVDLPSDSGAREPSWSPDGTWIVFALDRGGSSNVYAVRPDGTGLTRITDTHGTQDSGPDWRP